MDSEKRRKQKQTASFRSRLREFSFSLSWPIDERGYHVLRHNETKRRGLVVRKKVVVVTKVRATSVREASEKSMPDPILELEKRSRERIRTAFSPTVW
jgi:hypothetical protein